MPETSAEQRREDPSCREQGEGAVSLGARLQAVLQRAQTGAAQKWPDLLCLYPVPGSCLLHELGA